MGRMDESFDLDAWLGSAALEAEFNLIWIDQINVLTRFVSATRVNSINGPQEPIAKGFPQVLALSEPTAFGRNLHFGIKIRCSGAGKRGSVTLLFALIPRLWRLFGLRAYLAQIPKQTLVLGPQLPGILQHHLS